MIRSLRTFWPWLLVLLGYIAIVVLIFVPFEPVPIHLLLLLFAFFAIQFTAVLLHESGHLIACILLGELPATLQIGKGAVLKGIRFGPITIRLHATTNSGLVWSRHHFKNFNRADMFVLYAAGPVVDILVVGAVLWFLSRTPESFLKAAHFDHQIKPLLIITAVYVFYCQLSYLFHRSSYAFGQHSDAGGLVTLWPILGAPEPVRRGYVVMANAGYSEDQGIGAPPGPDERRSETELSTGTEGIETCSPWKRLQPAEIADLQAYYDWLIPKLPPEYANQFMDTFITNVVVYDLADQLAAADRYSAALIESEPNKITYIGSRGSVLIALGQIEAGKALLEKVYAESNSGNDRCISAAYLALAEQRLGNRTEAEAWFERAVAVGLDCPVIQLAGKELGIDVPS